MTDLFKLFAIVDLAITASFVAVPLQKFPANQTKPAATKVWMEDPAETTGTLPVAATEDGGIEVEAKVTTQPNGSNVDSPESKRVVAATVLGKPIYLDQFDPSPAELERLRKSGRSPWSRKAELLLGRVAGAVMMDYYRRKELHPTKAEISAKFSSGLRAHPELLAKMMLNKQARFEIGGTLAFGIASSIDWVVTKHLHEKYGGNVSVSSFGAMRSIEGRNELIRQYVERGDVQFHLPELERALWEQAEKKYALDSTIRDQKRVKEKFKNPPWENFAARLKKMALEQPPSPIAAESDRIMTLCLFPFADDPLWVICETEVSSLDDIQEMGSDACKANTTIETLPGNDKEAALKRGRALMTARKLPLYLLTIDKQGKADTLEEIGAPDVTNKDD